MLLFDCQAKCTQLEEECIALQSNNVHTIREWEAVVDDVKAELQELVNGKDVVTVAHDFSPHVSMLCSGSWIRQDSKLLFGLNSSRVSYRQQGRLDDALEKKKRTQ